jgi:Ras family protein U
MAPSQSPIISAHHYNHLRRIGATSSNNSSPRHIGGHHGYHNGHSPSLGGITTSSGAENGASHGSKIKCVFLGDGAVGKTSLIVSYTTNGYPNEYIPTAIDTYDVVVHVDGEPITFEMCDTPGQDDFDTLRPLVYPNTDVFLLCFSVVSPSSFMNIREKWIAEIRKGQKRVPVILVGTQSDLRNDVNTRLELAKYKEVPVSENEAKKMAKELGCDHYIETSALTQHNLKEVFDEAIMISLKGRKIREKHAAKKAARQQGCQCTIL